jgi:hypothetical protein
VVLKGKNSLEKLSNCKLFIGVLVPWRQFLKIQQYFVRFEVLMVVAMKNAVFWDIKPQFIPHRKRFTFPLQSPAG